MCGWDIVSIFWANGESFWIVARLSKANVGMYVFVETLGMRDKACVPFGELADSLARAFGGCNAEVLFAGRSKVLNDEAIARHGEEAGGLMVGINLVASSAVGNVEQR